MAMLERNLSTLGEEKEKSSKWWIWVSIIGCAPVVVMFFVGLIMLMLFVAIIGTSDQSKESAGKDDPGVIEGVKYAKYINDAAAQYGVDPALITAIIKQESNFQPEIKSSKSATGLMQIMPFNADGANLLDPRQNIMRGTQIIASHLKTYGGNLELALAAYNAGPGAVMRYGKVPPYKETQDYVVKVKGYYETYRGMVKDGKIEFASGSLKGISSPDSYPYKNASVVGVDAWKFYNRQCTSFVAWRLNDAGIPFYNHMRGGRFGNATNWDVNARKIGGIKVNKKPAPGAVAQWKAGNHASGFGHVAYVTEVKGDKITIEEYNYKKYSFSRRELPASQPSYYLHFKKGG